MAKFTSYGWTDPQGDSPLLEYATWMGGTSTEFFSSAYPRGKLEYHEIIVQGSGFVFSDATFNAYPVAGQVQSVTYMSNRFVSWTLENVDQPWVLSELTSGYEVAGVTYTGLEAARARWMSGDDELVGSSRSEHLRGMEGDDVLMGSAGGDILDGGPGLDSVLYSGLSQAYSFKWHADGLHVTHGGDADTLKSMERVHFEDRSLAFDLDAEAGDALRLLAALSGTIHLNNEAIVGEFLWYVDAMGLAQTAEFAVSSGLVSSLAGGSSDEALLNFLFSNLTGARPGEADLQWNLDYVRAAGLSQAQVIGLFAGLDITADRAGLVGVSSTGLEYLLYEA